MKDDVFFSDVRNAVNFSNNVKIYEKKINENPNDKDANKAYVDMIEVNTKALKNLDDKYGVPASKLLEGLQLKDIIKSNQEMLFQ